MDLVADGKGESPRAVSLRKNLDDLSPSDPALDRADIEIRRRKLLGCMGQVPVKRIRALDEPTPVLAD